MSTLFNKNVAVTPLVYIATQGQNSANQRQHMPSRRFIMLRTRKQGREAQGSCETLGTTAHATPAYLVWNFYCALHYPHLNITQGVTSLPKSCARQTVRQQQCSNTTAKRTNLTRTPTNRLGCLLQQPLSLRAAV